MTFDMAIPGTVLCVFVCRCVRSRYDLTIVAWMVGDEFVMLMAEGVGMVLDRLTAHFYETGVLRLTANSVHRFYCRLRTFYLLTFMLIPEHHRLYALFESFLRSRSTKNQQPQYSSTKMSIVTPVERYECVLITFFWSKTMRQYFSRISLAMSG